MMSWIGAELLIFWPELADRRPKVLLTFALRLVENDEHLVRFSLPLLAILADDPFQLCFLAVEVTMNVIHARLAANPEN